MQETATHAITWNTGGPYLPTVSLLLLNEQKQEVLHIKDNIPNTFTYSWTIPGNIKIGKYYISIRSTTTADQAFSDPFTISLAPIKPSVVIKK